MSDTDRFLGEAELNWRSSAREARNVLHRVLLRSRTLPPAARADWKRAQIYGGYVDAAPYVHSIETNPSQSASIGPIYISAGVAIVLVYTIILRRKGDWWLGAGGEGGGRVGNKRQLVHYRGLLHARGPESLRSG